MKIPKLAQLAPIIASLAAAVALSGCDSEAPPTGDATAAEGDGEEEPEPEDDDDADDGGNDSKPLALAIPGSPTPGGLHPCGNAELDAGEQCDDGLANGVDRECTLACTFNDCDLDQHGFCIDHWPAADVDLYPCADLGDDYDGCELGLAGG